LEAKSVQVFIDQDVGAEDSDSAQETGFPEMGRQPKSTPQLGILPMLRV
jgi:hypothetical protein